MNDLFNHPGHADADYTAKDIEVLEGLEPVRMRPGMYVGGTDEHALHHLVAEVLDNAMDEAVAGFASRIDLELAADDTVTVRDNGRGIPTDPHPKYRNKSALEVIMTTLHSGGKFRGKVYDTAGGLHGVGVSAVNALSDRLTVEVARDRRLWSQSFSRGKPTTPLRDLGTVQNRRGTVVSFHPDPDIFGARTRFRPAELFRMARSKAYLFRGVEIRWSCDPALVDGDASTPAEAVLHFPGGLKDFLVTALGTRDTVTPDVFAGAADLNGGSGRVEWAVAWPDDEDGFFNSYCNTVPTPQGGTHEQGLRTALFKGLRAFADLVGNKQAAKSTSDDLLGGACVILSAFIRDPQFQGQTKEKLSNPEAARLIEASVRDHFEHWLSATPSAANALLERVITRADARLRRRQEKETKRQSPTRRVRLPGKLTDCTRTVAAGTEVFLVEGDSAGGSAKQARERETQAVLPLRGKILNVASASDEKLRANQELRDLVEALGCGTGKNYSEENLRYDKVIVMTDADVDGAHIAALLMTFFFKEMPELVRNGHLFLAQPPLYRLSHGGKTVYARDDADKERLIATEFKGRKVDVSRFKGLGEMPPQQLRETTMDPRKRVLLCVRLPSEALPEERDQAVRTATLVEDLMGRKPETRLAFIQEHARFADVDV